MYEINVHVLQQNISKSLSPLQQNKTWHPIYLLKAHNIDETLFIPLEKYLCNMQLEIIEAF
jgi:hypothetical protein